MLENILQIDEQERRIFSKHFLRGVIIELTFDADVRIFFEKGTYSDIFKEKKYDNCGEIENTNFKITITDNTPVHEKTDETIGFFYVNNSNGNQVQIVHNRILFTQNEYSNFDNFIEEIKYFFENVIFLIPYDIKKIGFRKINSIVVSEVDSYADITDLFNKELFTFIKSGLFEFDTLENYRDNFTLRKNNTKIIVNTACSKIQNLSRAYEVTIDEDIILEESICKKDVVEILAKINQMHFDLFCWLTSQKMKEVMEEKRLEL